MSNEYDIDELEHENRMIRARNERLESEAKEMLVDLVNSPPHYQSDVGIECISAIRAAVGHEGFISHCRATAIKYLWRDKWDNVEDLRKSIWYIQKAIDEMVK